MKIAQFYDKDSIRLGIINADSLIPIDFQGEMIDFIKKGQGCRPSGKAVGLDRIKLAPSVSNPSKIVAIGLNYIDHIRESKGEIPESPLIFAKFPNSLIGHNDFIAWDEKLAKKVDFEAELAVIIGKTIHNCPKTEVMKAIFGYTCANDVSARDLQFGDGQWVRGKSLDTFCPLGPWIVTSDDIPDPHSLKIRCWLNGQIMQNSNTSMMVFKLPELISFISKNFTLIPGDVVITGTPHGVGAFREPSIYMKDGDEVVVEIEKVGRIVNICRTI
jgi:2-keto-4-pentenoate hydratase/2-oxohepta-3-ene-1,7-dioic acid hydratase in catechol pathway